MTEVQATSSPGLFGDDHADFRASARRYLETEVAPRREEWRHAGVPRELFGSLGELGLVAMAVPEAAGGAGIEDFRFNAVVVEEAMRAGLAGLTLMLSAHNDVCVPLLVSHGHDEWLAGLASGETIAAWVPGGVSLDGDRLSGVAQGVVNGGVADVLVVCADSGGEPVLLALDAATAERGPAPELVGPFACDRAEVRFDGVAVPGSARLEADAASALIAEQVSLAVAARAGARAALGMTLEYVQERQAFGQVIASFENTRLALAAVAAEIDAVDALVDASIAAHDSGDLAPARAAAAKLRATGLFGRAVDCGLQLHGGYGYMYDYEIAHAYSAARFLRLHGGTDEQLKATIAGSLGI